MKHVIAFDVSMRKSYLVVYNALKTCIAEKEIQHTREDFAALKLLIDDLTADYDEVLHLVFESIGVLFTPTRTLNAGIQLSVLSDESSGSQTAERPVAEP